MGALRDQIGERRQFVAPRKAILDGRVDVDAKLLGRGDHGQPHILGAHPARRARPKAHVAPTHASTAAQLRRVVVKRKFGMYQHLEQFGAVRPRFRNPVIQGIVVRDRRKERVETGFQASPFGRGRRLLIDTQFMIGGPIVLQEGAQRLVMDGDPGTQLLYCRPSCTQHSAWSAQMPPNWGASSLRSSCTTDSSVAAR